MKDMKRARNVKRAGSAKRILLFGFEDLPSILAVGKIAGDFGAELVTAPRESWGQPLRELAEQGPASKKGRESGPPAGRMLVLCGLEGELDALLPALNAAGASCPKAVLTVHNQGWTASRLFQELQRERDLLEGR